MTPAELIEVALREHLRIRPQERATATLKAGEPILVTGREAEEGARIAVDALAGAGLVIVAAEDLDDATDALAERESACSGSDCSDVYCQRVIRLRAALPERNDHGPDRP